MAELTMLFFSKIWRHFYYIFFPEIKCSHLQILDILSWVWLIIGTTIEWPPKDVSSQ